MRVRIAPEADDLLRQAVEDAGASVAQRAEDADALVWTGGPDGVRDELLPSIRWVQLSSAGVESWLRAGVIDGTRLWSSAAGAYAPQVAEHAVALLLACAHRLSEHARSGKWHRRPYRPLVGSRVAVVGGGGIGLKVRDLLEPMTGEVIMVTRDGRSRDGSEPSIALADMARYWNTVDHVVLAVPATPETAGLVDAGMLAALPAHACVVNVGRGSVVDTQALADALSSGRIAAAGLDVTDPEPLPEGHPLWGHPSVVITSHSANPPEALRVSLAAHVEENIRRYMAGEPLLGVVVPERGY
jgi:phosphoglycerate dehydrogenase-like enzyme